MYYIIYFGLYGIDVGEPKPLVLMSFHNKLIKSVYRALFSCPLARIFLFLCSSNGVGLHVILQVKILQNNVEKIFAQNAEII